MKAPRVDVLIAGIRWVSWSSLSLSVSVESLCRAATLRMVGAIDQIKIGQTAKILIDNEPILTGFVESVRVMHDATSLMADVTVSSKTQDLVDCHVRENRTFKGATLAVLLGYLADPYDIGVVVEVPTGALAKVTAQQGDGIQDVIERASRLAGVVVTDDGNGDLVVARPGLLFSGCDLSIGDGAVVSVQAAANGRGVFDAYDCRGSFAAPNAPDAAQLTVAKGEATGFGGRGRYLSVRPEQSASAADCARRAAWEAATRAGQSVTATVNVAGWYTSTGILWPVGQTIRARFPSCGLDAMMVVQSCNYSMDAESLGASLDLVPPAMYAAEPQLERKPGAAKTGSVFWDEADKYAAGLKGAP